MVVGKVFQGAAALEVYLLNPVAHPHFHGLRLISLLWGGEKFRKSKKATEVYCRRIWRNLLGMEPASVPEDWDLDVAREQGLMAGDNET